jgi:hypothetical protein
MIRQMMIALFGALVTGCSATLTSGIVAPAQDGDPSVDGVRYFGSADYEVGVYVLVETEKGKVYVPVADRKVVTLADTKALYQVGYEGAALASHEFKVELNPNGTLKAVSLTGKGDTGALTALNAANSVTTKLANVDKDALQRKVDELGLRVDAMKKEKELSDLLKQLEEETK